MGKAPVEPSQKLRQRAEELFRVAEDLTPKLTSPEAIKALLHELRVHQIELELQNEALRQAQNELGSSQERYVELYELAPIGYLTLSPERLIQEINLAAAKLLGAPRSALVKQPISQMLCKEDQVIFYQQLKGCSPSSPLRDFELRMLRGDGQLFWARLQLTVAQNGEYWLILEDISKSKPAENALKRSEAHFRAIFEHSTIGKSLIALDGQLLQVNQAFANMLGYSIEELQQLDFSQLTHPDDVAKSREAIRLLMVGAQTTCRFEKRYIHKSGRFVWGEVSTMLFSDEQGTPLHFITSIVDISKRKRAESFHKMEQCVLEILNKPNTVKKSVEQILEAFQTQFDFTAVGIRLQAGEDFPYFVQAGFSSEFLQTENSLLERTADGQICRGEDGCVCLEGTCGLVISGQSNPNNPLFSRGGSFWCNDLAPLLELPKSEDPRFHPRNHCIYQGYASIALIPIRDASRIVGLLHLCDRRKDSFSLVTIEILEGIACHIGEAFMRRQAEETNLKLAGQLQQSQKMEAIGTLAGGIAHDFNNILAAILGYSSLIRAQLDKNSKACHDIDQVITAGKRAADLVKQILSISRQHEKKLQPLRMQSIVQEVLKLLRATTSSLVTIQSSIDPDCPQLLADPTELHQLVMNLCTNANYALLEKGGGELLLKVDLQPVELTQLMIRDSGLTVAPGAFVKLLVTDTGRGMDNDTLARIFEPYYTTKKIGEGTGLGLAMVHSIITSYGGAILVQSELGVGTSFSVYLPIFKSADEQAAQVQTAPLPRGDERILVVDDEQAIATLRQRILGELGYRVTVLTDAEEALQAFVQQPDAFDLIITDMNMPKMLGTSLAQACLSIRPGIPIILCTGFSHNIDSENSKAAGFSALLSKPVEANVLAAAVRRVLDEKSVEEI